MNPPAIFAIRPEPGLARTIAAARSAGLTVAGFPLFEPRAVDWQSPEGRFDGLLAGSAALFRLGGPQLAGLRSVPVHAVGAATAEAAQAAGFVVIEIGSGGLAPLAAALPPGRYLRLAGEEHVPLDPAPGALVETVVVYRMAPLPMPPALSRALSVPSLVLLHSGAAARHFAAECDRLQLGRSAIRLATLAPRVAGAAGSGWAAVAIAERPDDAALLALVRQMCQTGEGVAEG